ncbi:hypothetical protein C8J56DRAFT_1046155 [Mycena floridula]|nr:hypothetical protein C8J56DRAFT_1046155 [Mycena floridula]
MNGRMAHVSRLAFEPPPQIVKDCSTPAQDPVLSISATAREQLFHHSRENVLPTEVEILKTKANIAVERSAIELLKQRISELQQEVEIRELNLEHYRTIISPIRRIPNETLGGIFQDAVDDAAKLDENIHHAVGSFATTQYPLVESRCALKSLNNDASKCKEKYLALSSVDCPISWLFLV